MGVRGAHIGMDGNVISGVNVLSGQRNIVPPAGRISAGTPASESGAGRLGGSRATAPTLPNRDAFKIKPIMGDALGGAFGDWERAKISTDKMRQAAALKDAANAEDAVYAEMGNQALRKSARATPTLTDMRPAKYHPELQTHREGALYREKEQGVIDEQRAARENTRPEDRYGEFRQQQSDGYRQAEARSRTDAAMRGPDLTGKLPTDTRKVVLTDPKYGGAGFGFARKAMMLPTPARLPNPSMPKLAIDARPNAAVPSRPLPTYSAAAPLAKEAPSEPKEVEPPVPPSPVRDGGMSESDYPKKVQYRRQNGRMRPV